MAVEVYKVSIPVEVDDKTPQGFRGPQQRVTAFERSLERMRRQAERTAREVARHQVFMQRQQLATYQATARLHMAQAQRERAQLVARREGVRVQREEARLQRDHLSIQRAQFSLQQQQERIARVADQRGIRARILGGVRGVLGGAVRGVGSVVGSVARGVFSLPGALVGSAAVAGGVFWPSRLAMEAEAAEFALTHLLRSEERARRVLQNMRAYATDTAFSLPDVRGATTQLLGAYIGRGDAIEPSIANTERLIRNLGDVAALQQNPAQALDRAVYAVRQMITNGRVLLEEVNQLTDAGLPALSMLAQGYGISANEMRKWMETSTPPASLQGRPIRSAIDVLNEQIERSSFAGGAARQAATTSGLVNTAVDVVVNEFITAWGRGLIAPLGPRLRELVTWLKSSDPVVSRWNEGLRTLGETASEFVVSSLETLVRRGGEILNDPAFLAAETFSERVTLAAEAMGLRRQDVEDFGKSLQGVASDVRDIIGFLADLVRKLRDFDEWWKNSPFAGHRTPTSAGAAAGQATRQAVGGFLQSLPDNARRAVEEWLGQDERNRPPGGGGPGGPGGGTAGGWGSVLDSLRAQGVITPSTAPGAEQAIAKGMGYLGSQAFINWCLKFVDDLFGASGERFPTAWSAAQKLATQRGGSLMDVPRGQLAFLRADASNQGAGHVMLALGGGRFLDPSSQGVRITAPGDPLYTYYQGLYYGYGQHGAPGALPLAPLDPTVPAAATAGGAAAGAPPVSVSVGEMSVTVQDASDPQATVDAIADGLMAEIANRVVQSAGNFMAPRR